MLILPVLLLLAGCQARQLDAMVSPTRADAVDATWITAVRTCWPALSHASTASLAASLLDPHSFRGAFPGFAPLNDKRVELIAAQPVVAAPPVDRSVFRNAVGPPITREQATTAGFKPEPADGQQPNADTLCVLHTGSPVGFR